MNKKKKNLRINTENNSYNTIRKQKNYFDNSPKISVFNV